MREFKPNVDLTGTPFITTEICCNILGECITLWGERECERAQFSSFMHMRRQKS